MATPGTNPIENYSPETQYNGGIYSALPMKIANDLTVTGTTNIAAISLTDLTVTGNTTIGDATTDTLTVTGNSTFAGTATGTTLGAAMNTISTGKVESITSTSTAITSGNLLNVGLTSSGTLAAKTGATVNVAESMTHTADADVTENFDSVKIARTVIRNTGGTDTHTTTSQGALLELANTITATTGTITDTVDGLKVTMSGNGTGNGLNVTAQATGGRAALFTGAGTTVSDVKIVGSGAKASGKGSLEVTNSGATAAGGAVLYVSATGTPAATTSYLAAFDNSGITATNNPQAVFINQKGTEAALAITAAVQSTHFYKIATMNSVTLWMGDGNTANGALSGTAGDILFNGGSHKPEYCTGTTNWTALV